MDPWNCTRWPRLICGPMSLSAFVWWDPDYTKSNLVGLDPEGVADPCSRKFIQRIQRAKEYLENNLGSLRNKDKS